MKIAKAVAVGLLCLASASATLGTEEPNQGQTIKPVNLSDWQQPLGIAERSFELEDGKGEFKAWGKPIDYRVFFPEFLSALFERTLSLEHFDVNCRLEWIFTGETGGFTVTIDNKNKTVSLSQRFYDSFAFNKIKGEEHSRHPEWQGPAVEVRYNGRLRAVTVSLDHKLGLSVALNGRTVLQQLCLLDISQHQLRLTGNKAAVSGKMLQPMPRSAVVQVNPNRRYQTMMGFGGIATPTAYAQLSYEGKQRWWKLVCEYNLLIQREYPNGTRLNREMDNWDRLEDATPHYYGDNFPNGEISDFDYIKALRKLGGKVFFEFWDLPKWVGTDTEKYAEAIVRYCQVSKDRTGTPPDIVGIQNEVGQSPEMWHKMTLSLRRKLDQAGFKAVGIHMSDDGDLNGGIERAKAFRSSKRVWAAIDYSATHMYDYQNYFTDPDGFDERLVQWKELTDDKPFLSTELCINRDQYQINSYRIALTMGQLYHKNLVVADASALCYCWTLLNIVQPSYGYTRTLFVPEKSRGFVPVPSSCQLRIFGAYSRRIHEGMVRVEVKTETQDLLVSAFAGDDSTATVVLLNRSTKPRRLHVKWPGVKFTEMETVSPYYENKVRKAPATPADGAAEIAIEPGCIVTLTNVPLGRFDDDVVESATGSAKSYEGK